MRYTPPQFQGWRTLDCRTSEAIERVLWVEITGITRQDSYAQMDKPPKVDPQTGTVHHRIVGGLTITKVPECKTFAINANSGQLRALRHQS